MKLVFAFLALIASGLALATPSPSHAGDCGGPWGAPARASKDLVDTAASDGAFTTLVRAVQAADLVETLKADGPFTVFAPTDAAFGDLPPDTLNDLLNDKVALRRLLTYHVVPGRIPAARVLDLDWAKSVEGQSLRIASRNGGVYVDGARIVKADIETSNGILHVIDRVLLPRQDILAMARADGSFDTLLTAVQAADLVAALEGEGPFTVFAPADAAFAKLPTEAVQGLLEDKPALARLLTYHVVRGRVLAQDIPQGSTTLPTVNGRNLTIRLDRSGTWTVNGARVVTTDILAGNGVIHRIDAVVFPPQG